VAGASNNGNGGAASSTALMTLGTGPGEALAAVPGQGFGFDENQPVVAEAPGGEWSRFKTYSIFAVRHPARWTSAPVGAAARRRSGAARGCGCVARRILKP
jgi:hypothetical protein